MDLQTKNLGRWFVAFVAACSIVVFAGCDSSPSATPDNLPADHTARNGGIPHKPGFSTPFSASSGCTNCHGADLRGGTAAIDGMNIPTPSCFSCHGQKWSS